MLRTATIALAFLVAGCMAPPPDDALRDATLSAASGPDLSRDALLSRISSSAIVYLGEKHDNRFHHEHQFWVLRELIARGHRPVLGLEIFAATQSSALMEFISAPASTHVPDSATARLRRATDMQDDERWLRYGPLLEFARAHQLTVFGIDLPVPLRRRVSRVGVDGLTPAERNILPHDNGAPMGIDDGTDPAYREQMLARLKSAHCGHGSPAYLARLFENWQLRNETMARTIATTASARGNSPVLVVLGSGHVRNGEGVVPRVAKHLPGTKQLIVSFIEIDESGVNPNRHRVESRTGAWHSKDQEEVLWFTAPSGLSTNDACKAFQHNNRKAPAS